MNNPVQLGGLSHSRRSANQKGFTLVEALITIAIIGIMAGLMVSAFSNAAQDGNRAVARQQQAALQEALNSWIGGDGNRVTNSSTTSTSVYRVRAIEEIRTAYNAMNTTQRLAAMQDYLAELVDTRTNETMFWVTSSTRIKSRALDSIKFHLDLPTWTSTGYPTVRLVTD